MLTARLRDLPPRLRRWIAARRWDLTLALACLALATLLCARLLATGMRACHEDWVYFHTLTEISRRAVLEHGTLPFWNPYTCGGIEHLGNPQTTFFSPLFVLILLYGFSLGLKLFAWAHLAIGLLGGVRLGRELGLSRPWSLALAIVVAASPFHLWHLYAGHIPFLQFQWFPWIVWSYVAARRRPILALWGAASLGVAILGGGGYVAAFAAVFLGAHALVATLVERPRWAPLATAAGMVAGGVALGAAKVLPAMAFVRQFERPPLPDESLSLEQLARMFLDSGWQAEELHLSIWEYGNYLGPGVALLVVLGAAGVRRGWPWLAVAALALALTAGHFASWAPYSLLVELPVFSSLRVPSRYTFLVVFAMAMAAAHGLGAARPWIDARAPAWRLALRGALAALGLVSVAAIVHHGQSILPADICRDAPNPLSRPERFHLVQGSYWRMWQTVRDGLGTIHCRAPMRVRRSAGLWLGDHEQVLLVPPDAGDARVIGLEPDRWRVRVDIDRPAVLRLNQHHRPSFEVSRGTLVNRGGLIGVYLQPGAYELEIAYRAPGARAGLGLSAGAWLALLAMAGYAHRRRRVRARQRQATRSTCPADPVVSGHSSSS